ncbi:hypothetical protein [Stackebrandtia soli]|uniref:hypothetical protein n=1 Tax=Stackebrandtia soli TaxID=1892856 RepID=UPI0039EBDD18
MNIRHLLQGITSQFDAISPRTKRVLALTAFIGGLWALGYATATTDGPGGVVGAVALIVGMVGLVRSARREAEGR